MRNSTWCETSSIPCVVDGPMLPSHLGEGRRGITEDLLWCVVRGVMNDVRCREENGKRCVFCGVTLKRMVGWDFHSPIALLHPQQTKWKRRDRTCEKIALMMCEEVCIGKSVSACL